MVINFINDGHDEDTGTHWTVLVAWKIVAGGDLRNFRFLHLDSLRKPNAQCYERATAFAQRLTHLDAKVDMCRCAKQTNGYDCGLYALVFAYRAVSARARAASNVAFHLGREKWQG